MVTRCHCANLLPPTKLINPNTPFLLQTTQRPCCHPGPNGANQAGDEAKRPEPQRRDAKLSQLVREQLRPGAPVPPLQPGGRVPARGQRPGHDGQSYDDDAAGVSAVYAAVCKHVSIDYLLHQESPNGRPRYKCSSEAAFVAAGTPLPPTVLIETSFFVRIEMIISLLKTVSKRN